MNLPNSTGGINSYDLVVFSPPKTLLFAYI
jgi:hypothetical protein